MKLFPCWHGLGFFQWRASVLLAEVAYLKNKVPLT